MIPIYSPVILYRLENDRLVTGQTIHINANPQICAKTVGTVVFHFPIVSEIIEIVFVSVMLIPVRGEH